MDALIDETHILKHFTTVQFSRFTNVLFYLVLRCARAILGDNDILDRCPRDLPLPLATWSSG